MKDHLEGIRILDLTCYLSGPFASMNLSAMGAEVLKIERPRTGDPCRWNPPFAGVHGVSFESKDERDLSVLYLKRNRGKKSIFLDLKQEEGKEIFLQLVKKSDVVMENFVPGAMDRLGLDYERLAGINPRIIYCSISGYGQSGPLRNRPAFDLTIQATSGVMGLTGHPGQAPVKCGAWIGDMIASLYTMSGILAAIHSREKTGVGERIDVAMNDACFSLCTDEAMDLNIAMGRPVRTGNRLGRLAPWNSYQAKDGYVVICVANNTQWVSLLEAIGREDLKDEPRFQHQQGRYQNAEEIEEIIKAWTRDRTKADILAVMDHNKVPAEAIAEFSEVLENPQLEHREMIQEVVHPVAGAIGLKAAGFPIKFTRLKAGPMTPAPYPGQHSDEIYLDLLQIPPERLEVLKKKGVL